MLEFRAFPLFLLKILSVVLKYNSVKNDLYFFRSSILFVGKMMNRGNDANNSMIR